MEDHSHDLYHNDTWLRTLYESVIGKFKRGDMIVFSPHIFSEINFQLFLEWFSRFN